MQEQKIICTYEFKAKRNPYPESTPYNYCPNCPHEDVTQCDKFMAFTPQGEPVRRGRNAIVLDKLIEI